MIRLPNRSTGEVVERLQITVDRNGADRLVDIVMSAAGRDGRQEVHVQSHHVPPGVATDFWLVVSESELLSA